MRPAVHEADVGIAFHPAPALPPTGIGDVVADARATRSMKINPWIRHPRPAATLMTSGDYQLLTRQGIRSLAIAEAACLSSFPSSFVWNDDAWQRIGNAVPPAFMEHIARHVAMTLLDHPVIPATSRPLDFIDKPINPPGPYVFNVVSLFAGCGGSSLGYKWAGGKVLAAIEWDHNAAETYRLNHHGTPVMERDIKTVTPEELLALTGLQPGELDILDGSPPCQGFSTAGKRNFYDDRNDLFAEYVRLLRGVQPKVFVMENVSGMVKGHMKHIFARIMRELKASGYTVKAQLMNAMYFGVPQSRERVIIIGVRDDVPSAPRHPTAQTTPVCVDEVYPKVRAIRTYGAGYHIRWIDSRRAHPTLQSDPSQKPTRWRIAGQEQRPSTEQLATIASFPSAFRWPRDADEAWKRIGNTVPPRFMQAIAEHVRDQVLAPVMALGLAGQAPGAR